MGETYTLDGRRTVARSRFYLIAVWRTRKARATHRDLLLVGSRGRWTIRGRAR